jgi:hypothetical protein
VLLLQGLQRSVPVVEEAVAQVLRVHKAPLPPTVLIAPVVALPAFAMSTGGLAYMRMHWRSCT